jgi:hypothetical protein
MSALALTSLYGICLEFQSQNAIRGQALNARLASSVLIVDLKLWLW